MVPTLPYVCEAQKLSSGHVQYRIAVAFGEPEPFSFCAETARETLRFLVYSGVHLLSRA